MPPQQQQGNPNDHSSGLLWIVAAIFATIGIIWFAFRNQLIHFYLSIKLYELQLMAYMSGWFRHPYYFDQLRMNLNYARANPSAVNFHDLMVMGNAVGYWLRMPLVVILIGLTIVLYFTNTTRLYRRTYSMQSLVKTEEDAWPQIKPVVDLNLLKADIDKGPWAMAMTPMQFCKRHRLLMEVKPTRGDGRPRKEWGRIDVVLKRGDANQLFALQLGGLWQGIDKVPLHARALFAVFAARINADTKPALALLKQLSSTTAKYIDMKGVDALLNKHINTKEVQKIVQTHAYYLTLMASMLQGARDDGVQASADFLWLKPVDRRLWYMLNTVGRQTPFIEVAGPFAHWIAEKELGRPIFVPMIEEATNAVEIALKDVIYRPDEV